MTKGFQRHLRQKRLLHPLCKQSGFVLVTVLVIMAVLIPVVFTFASRIQSDLLSAGNYKDELQSIWMARAGVQGAMGLLKSDDASYDCTLDKWAIAFPGLAVGDGILHVSIKDEDSKLNINRLVAPNGKDINTQVYSHLSKLISRLGGKPEIVEALIDWMDADSDSTGSFGAEEQYYSTLGYHCKNAHLDSLEELLLVKGFDKDLLFDKGLANFITVAPTDGKLNVNTAEITVLYDLHPEIREGIVKEIVSNPLANEVYKSIDDVKKALGLTDALWAKLVPLIKVNSSVFTVKSSFTIGNIKRTVTAVLQRNGDMITILSWSEN